MMKKILLALFIISLFLFGCVKQPISEAPEEVEPPIEEIEEPTEVPEPEPIGKMGTLKLLVSDEDNVISDFDSVTAVFNKIKIYKPKSSEPIEQDIDVTADLTELQDKIALKLIEMNLDEGKYSKIKLYTSSVKGVLLGNEVEVIIPGDALTVEKNFETKGEKTTTFVVDLKVVKTGKVTTTTGLERYNLQTVPEKSGTVPMDVTLVEEITAAEMQAKINEKAGKKYDRHVFFTQEKGFTPPDVTIETGTKVVWENKDTKKLGILMGGVFDTFIRTGGSYEHTFNRAGTFPYNMKFFLSNKGTITIVLPEEKVEEEVVPGTPRTVYMKETGFSSAEISIKKGTKVTFMNKDTKNHKLVISADALAHMLAPGESYSYTYNELGGFPFYDAYNVGKYSGKVTVS